MILRQRLSEIHPIFYHTRIWQKRAFRTLSDLPLIGKFASEISKDDLKFTSKKHQSLLRRRLGNSDPELQENKVKSLNISSDDRRNSHQTRADLLILATDRRGDGGKGLPRRYAAIAGRGSSGSRWRAVPIGEFAVLDGIAHSA